MDQTFIQNLINHLFNIPTKYQTILHSRLLDIICCPNCHHDFNWTNIIYSKDSSARIISADIHCSKNSKHFFQVDNGIAIFLTDQISRDDLWKKIESNLVQHVKKNSDIYDKLVNTELSKLHPTDKLFRSMVLNSESKYEDASRVRKIASKEIYTKEYSAAIDSQLDFIINKITDLEKENLAPDFVVDIASGLGGLVFPLLEKTQVDIVMTDFSPTVLFNVQKILVSKNFLDRVSLIAFDAKLIPFKKDSLSFVTTNLGLPNIDDSEKLFTELDRILSIDQGQFFGIHYCLTEEDNFHLQHFEKDDNLRYLSKILNKNYMKKSLEKFDWKFSFDNIIPTKADPTLPGKNVAARPDGFPVESTILEWMILNISITAVIKT